MGIDSYQYREKKAASAGAPIVFTFHGSGGDKDQFLPLAERILPEAGVVSPRGDVSSTPLCVSSGARPKAFMTSRI
jgi:phospholipase/carboxylesterase